MRGLRFFLIVVLACAYFVCLRIMFQGRTAQASLIESIPTPGSIERVIGNRGLMCLVLLRNGDVEMVDAGHEIDTRNIVPEPGATRFTMASLTPSGVGYLLDDRNMLYRVTMSGDRATSKPIAADGQVLAMAVQQKRGLLWLAVKRQQPHPDSLFVLTIGLTRGKILNSANLDKQGSPVVFETAANGEKVLLTTDGSPSLYVFDYMDKTPFTKAVTLGDLVTSVAYSRDNPVLGLRSGAAVMLDPETWGVAGSVDSGQYPATATGASPSGLGIGHGASNHRAETGSFQSVDLRSWNVTTECVAKSVVTATTAIGDRFLYGTDSGDLDVLSQDGGCESLDIPKSNLPGPVRFMASAGSVCLVVGDRSIVRLLFQ